LTNGILAVLTDVERKNRNFSMDVVFINHQLKICKSVRERELVTYGGNKIPDNMKEILLSLQKPQTCNYNIILFDGDAMCNNDYNTMSMYQRVFKVFDMKQTTLITDPANEMYIDNGFTSTKVVITQNYTSKLIKHITRALTIAFG
jgi:beta-galactosidase/beta-glucuronidase